MFNPAQTASATTSVRSSRRRQRSSNDGSISQPKAKRLRSTLNEKTFIPPDTDKATEIQDLKAARVMNQSRQSNGDIASLQKEVVVRGRKPRATDQSSKGDGSLVLTTNETYTVSKLPALPDRLRADVTGRQHGTIDTETGYALTLSHTHAIIWPYTANMHSPETFTFALPHPSKHVSDPLPLGSLVSPPASSSEPGLVVIVPTTGKITYWESIASAATLDLRLQRGGVELVLPGMHSGETVVQLLNAESAGFILGLSSGRIAYMSVRDGQGRPTINVQFLRNTSITTSGGLFGSIRNALSASTWKGDIAAAHAAPSEQVGQRDVVVATAKGRLQAWEIHRGGHAAIISESDVREPIVMSIKHASPELGDLDIESFELLDFAFIPRSANGTRTVYSDQLEDSTRGDVCVLVLTSLKGRGVAHYSLVEVSLRPDGVTVNTVRPVKTYTTPVNKAAIAKPRLYLPHPLLVAYLVFDRAVVVLSMAKQPENEFESPDIQLRRENQLAPQAFEDVVDLREELSMEIVGSGCEEPRLSTNDKDDLKSRRHRPRHPAAVLIVRGGGLLRVAATDVARLLVTKPQPVTARSKLEQAVFFGTIEQNPLKFSVRPGLEFSPDEVGAAAIELSLDILSSRVPYIPSTPASVDQNLRKRSKALHDLADYIKSSDIKIDRSTRWKLLAHAEKLASASTLWKQYENGLRIKRHGAKRGVFAELVECIHEDWKTEPVAEIGEVDRVRHWFIHDIWNLEIALPWTFQIMKMAYQEGQTETPTVLDLIAEGNDILLGALTSAFNFRSASLKNYGLENEDVENGILSVGYEDLPEPWTSSVYLARNTQKQSSFGAFLLKQVLEQSKKDIGHLQPLLERLRTGQPAMIECFIRVNSERIRWEAAQESPQLQVAAEERRQQQAEAEREQLTWLAESDLVDEAMHLAEKYEILDTLAVIALNLVASLTQYSLQEPVISENKLKEVSARIKGYFVKFGSRWASAFFEQQISGEYQGSLEYLFEGFPDELEQGYLSDFLRKHPEYSKISWIQDIIQNQDFTSASNTLLSIGLHREQNLWSKQIELSLGKLASLASQNKLSLADADSVDLTKIESLAIDHNLALIRIQKDVYDHILLTISTAIDDNAELQLAVETHGNVNLKNRPRLRVLLEEALSCLLRQETLSVLDLVDLLTLMTPTRGESSTFDGTRFCLALDAVRHGNFVLDEKRLVQRVIWRRCMLQDNWIEINNTDSKDDTQVSDQLRETALYGTFRACLENRLFEKSSGIAVIEPADVLGAGTDQLDKRFKGLDASIRESVMKDLQDEDDELKPLMEKARLEKWFHGVFELAKQDYAESVTAETNNGQHMRGIAEELQKIEKAIFEKEHAKGESLLKSRLRCKPKAKMNGSGNLRTSHRER